MTLVRAQLTWMDVINDPYADQMLPANYRRVAAAARLPGLRLLNRHSSFPYLAARTLFCDAFVTGAVNDGIRQVVVVAAGYDSRAWRLSRAGVTFFEIDQPATQAEKRARAPEGGPVYVAADAGDRSMADALTAAGYVPGQPTAFVVEGLTIYLAEHEVADLLGTLAQLGGAGSRLAVTFESGFERQRFMRRFAAAYYGRAGEPLRFRLRAADAAAFVAKTGWTIDHLLTDSTLQRDYLSHTKLAPVTLDTSSFIVEASRLFGR